MQVLIMKKNAWCSSQEDGEWHICRTIGTCVDKADQEALHDEEDYHSGVIVNHKHQIVCEWQNCFVSKCSQTISNCISLFQPPWYGEVTSNIYIIWNGFVRYLDYANALPKIFAI